MVYFIFIVHKFSFERKIIEAYFIKTLNSILNNDITQFQFYNMCFNNNSYYFVKLFTCIVFKEVPAPFFRHQPLDPVCPLLKSLLPLFSIPPPFKVFQTVPPPPHRQPPSCPNPKKQPSLHIIQVSKNIKRGILPVHLLLSIKNQFLII